MGETNMNKQQQILGFPARPASMMPGGNDNPPFGRDAIDLGYKVWIRTITRTAGQMLLAILFTACCGSALAQTAAAQQYQVSYLDSLGGTSSRGNSINNRGWIAGFSRLAGDPNRHATLWQNDSILDLGTLGSPDK